MRQTLPFSRPIRANEVPPEGLALDLVAEPAERERLAKDFGLVGIDRLEAHLEVRPVGRGGLAVKGEVEADIRQTCVVTLDPFDDTVREPIDVRFAEEGAAVASTAEGEEPDRLVDGVADLGALAAEFVALGLDPHPRKPGVAFEAPAVEEGGETDKVSPFAALERALTRKAGGD